MASVDGFRAYREVRPRLLSGGRAPDPHGGGRGAGPGSPFPFGAASVNPIGLEGVRGALVGGKTDGGARALLGYDAAGVGWTRSGEGPPPENLGG